MLSSSRLAWAISASSPSIEDRQEASWNTDTSGSQGDPGAQVLHQERDKDAFRAAHLACFCPWIRVRTGAAGEAGILPRDDTGTRVSVGSCACCKGCRRKADTTLPGQKDQLKEHSLTFSGTLKGQRCLLPRLWSAENLQNEDIANTQQMPEAASLT